MCRSGGADSKDVEIGSQDGNETVVASTNKTRRNRSVLRWALGSLEILTLTSDRNQLNACRAKEEWQGYEPGPWSRRRIDSRLSNQRPVRLMMQSLPCGPWTRATGYDNGGQGMGSRLTNSDIPWKHRWRPLMKKKRVNWSPGSTRMT